MKRLVLLAAVLSSLPAWAEKADREKPTQVEANRIMNVIAQHDE